MRFLSSMYTVVHRQVKQSSSRLSGDAEKKLKKTIKYAHILHRVLWVIIKEFKINFAFDRQLAPTFGVFRHVDWIGVDFERRILPPALRSALTHSHRFPAPRFALAQPNCPRPLTAPLPLTRF